jgi:hypothetical protein
MAGTRSVRILGAPFPMPGRNWLRFRMGTLLLMVLLLSVPLAWFGRQYNQGRRADALLRELGGSATCRWRWNWRWGQVSAANLQGADITDDDLERLSSFRTLHSIYLRGTAVTDRGLVHLSSLPHLVDLDLSDTAITDAGLPYLANLENLRFLQAHRTQITAESVAELKRKLPDVRIYYLAQ